MGVLRRKVFARSFRRLCRFVCFKKRSKKKEMQIKPNTRLLAITIVSSKTMNSLNKYKQVARVLQSVSPGMAHNPLGYIKRRTCE